jgi:hypothetical protein
MSRSLFSTVNTAVGEALATRPSKLDTIDWECWTKEMLAEDALNVFLTIDMVCQEHGWTADAFNRTYKRLRDNRHHQY